MRKEGKLGFVNDVIGVIQKKNDCPLLMHTTVEVSADEARIRSDQGLYYSPSGRISKTLKRVHKWQGQLTHFKRESIKGYPKL